MDLEWVRVSIGEFGPFQKRILGLFYFITFIKAPFSYFGTFIAANVEHRCFVPACDANNPEYCKDHLNFSTPYDKNHKRWQQCYFYGTLDDDPNNGSCSRGEFSHNFTQDCTRWIYSKDQFLTTAVTEYDLVCERSWLAPLSTSSYMLGMSSSILIGYVCDRWGRKVGLILSIMIMAGGGLAAALSPNYATFAAMRFINGLGANGLLVASYTTAIEYLDLEWRAFCGTTMNAPFSVGGSILGVVAYFIRDFRLLQIACTVPTFILLSYVWLMPESIRWLIAKNRTAEALKVAKLAAKMNGLKEPTYTSQKENGPHIDSSLTKKEQKSSVLDILRLPNMRKRTIILCYGWAVCTLVYYGISMNSGNLSGDLYINFIATTLIEIPGFLSAYFALERLGRRLTMCSVYLLCGSACIISGFIPSYLNWLIIVTTLIGKFGISAAFGSIFVYTAEIYPTEYRSVGLGACNVCARIGGVIAPLVANLGTIYSSLPTVVFGVLSLLAGLVFIPLPETKGLELPQTLQESENISRKKIKPGVNTRL